MAWPAGAGCEFGTNEALKQAVRAGPGLGVVSVQTIEFELWAGCLVVLPVEGLLIVRRWYVLHGTHKLLSDAARTFREMLLGLDPSTSLAAARSGRGRSA